MSARAIATNEVRPATNSHIRAFGGVTVNGDIPVGSIEPWRTAAIQKVLSCGQLNAGWDGRGSNSPSRSVRQTAIEFLMQVPSIGSPRIVPTSGGGYHFEWALGDRELEVSIDADCTIEALRVQNGMPLEDDSPSAVPALFGWLLSK